MTEELTPDQMRRLKAHMTDPVEPGQPATTLRNDRVDALVAMIERRDQKMIDFVQQIQAELEDGKYDRALDRCKAFWRGGQ